MISSEQDTLLAAFGDGRLGLLITNHEAYHRGLSGHVRAGITAAFDGQPCYVIHVMSKPAGGEIRGYIWVGDAVYIRLPLRMEWIELDQIVCNRLGLTVVIDESGTTLQPQVGA
jgi:hypothetical protein